MPTLISFQSKRSEVYCFHQMSWRNNHDNWISRFDARRNIPEQNQNQNQNRNPTFDCARVHSNKTNCNLRKKKKDENNFSLSKLTNFGKTVSFYFWPTPNKTLALLLSTKNLHLKNSFCHKTGTLRLFLCFSIFAFNLPVHFFSVFLSLFQFVCLFLSRLRVGCGEKWCKGK